MLMVILIPFIINQIICEVLKGWQTCRDHANKLKFFLVMTLFSFSFIDQGEDVVAGIRTPEDLDTMKNCMPEAYRELVENCEILERHYKDMMVFPQ